MAGRGRTSFQKRQKEQLRLERRQQKAARKQERQANKGTEPETADVNEFLPDFDDDFVPGEDLNPAGGLSRGGSNGEPR
jgi:hypothetical protein